MPVSVVAKLTLGVIEASAGPSPSTSICRLSGNGRRGCFACGSCHENRGGRAGRESMSGGVRSAGTAIEQGALTRLGAFATQSDFFCPTAVGMTVRLILAAG